MIDWTLLARYAAPLLTLFVGVALNRWLDNRPKLISYLAHANAIQFPAPDGGRNQVNTHSIVVRNAGRKAAINLRLGHNILPDFSVYPAVEHRVIESPGGREIVFPSLVPKEQITVAYLYFPPLIWSQINTYTKSDEGLARIVNVLPAPQLPRWQIWLAWVLIALGAVTILTALTQIIIYMLHFAL